MEQDNTKYNELINRLKKTPPVLTNPKELTEKIINSLPSQKRTSRVVAFTGWVSGAAAALLLCLLVSEHVTHATLNTSGITSVQAIPQLQNADVNTEETIINVIRKNQEIMAKKERIYTNYKNKTESNRQENKK